MAATLMAGTSGPARASEPDLQTAIQWWPELKHVVTPVGWREHLHRFHIVYDGTILARPPNKPTRFEGETDAQSEGVQLTFIPSSDGVPPPERNEPYQISLPGGAQVGDQGWTNDPAPVLWTRLWPRDDAMKDVELRQLVFAHMAGGGESQTGVEPMFAWVRIEVTEAPAAAARCGLLIKLNAYHLDFAMLEPKNAFVHPENSTYPRTMRWEPTGDGDSGLLVEEDGRIRLGVLPGGATDVKFMPRAPGARDNYLHVSLPAKRDAYVDLLVPMIRAERAVFNEEQKLGRDGALAQANAFWSPRPASAASIHTPEPFINEAIEHSIRLARMITLTIPSTRQKSLLSGSMVYSVLWNTPTSMTSHMLLDPMGWHGDVAKYLEIHRQDQGTQRPPGDGFPQHPGYFGVPKPLDVGYQWLTDHGAVMYTACRHALITGDEQFVERWLEPILKGCQFIKDARKLPRQPPQVEGVMPSASASDKKDPIQSFWSDGWNYKGLASAVRLLRQINHPRAEEFEREAEDYRQAIVAAFRAKAARMPKWKDKSGQEHPIVPMSLNDDDSNGYGISHPFYLDIGPIFGVYAGVLPADDELMRAAVAFLREGAHVPDAFSNFHWEQTPYLWHEMSSCEPCYSWNVFHSHQLGDRQRYLEAMYSLFAGSLSRQTYIGCETRDGITETVFSAPLAVQLARLAVVDDEIEPGTLHLLRLAPLAWVSAAEETRFENMPTEFGPVTLKWMLSGDGKTLQLSYTANFRRNPDAVVLHVPPIEGLEQVLINGQPRRAKAGEKLSL